MGKLTLFACVAQPRDHIQRRHKLSLLDAAKLATGSNWI